MTPAEAPSSGTGVGATMADYQYDLPDELIAQYPSVRRDESRLMVMGSEGTIGHRVFRDLTEIVQPGDILVVNESRVFPARLRGHKSTGAAGEILLIRQPDVAADPALWEALVRPGRKLGPGSRLEIGDELAVEVVDVLPSGNRAVRLVTSLPVDVAIDRYGHVPLPPYIGRPDAVADHERYQTVYARQRGSVAAPTAGLHFTNELLGALARRGIERAAVTLHVGIGTFRPVDVEDPAQHVMHSEWYSVTPEAADAVNAARGRGGRVWAVGTTAVRTLESAADDDGRLHAGSGETNLFIRPPWDFRVVEGLITNLHLPRSTLLMLVAALAGYETTMNAYSEAVRERYRFYSYGDAMAITPGARSR